jgi:hypothetical protein
MKNQLSCVALLLAVIFAFVGCEGNRRDAASKGRNTRRPALAQTGTNIPREMPRAAKNTRKAPRADKKKREAARPTPTPKPKREKKPARDRVDEDVVIRGGFR